MGQNFLSKHSSELFEKCIGRYFSLQREEEEEEEEEKEEEEEEIIRNSTFFEHCTWIVFNLEENLEGKFVSAVRSSVRSDVIRNRGASGLFYGAERISRWRESSVWTRESDLVTVLGVLVKYVSVVSGQRRSSGGSRPRRPRRSRRFRVLLHRSRTRRHHDQDRERIFGLYAGPGLRAE